MAQRPGRAHVDFDAHVRELEDSCEQELAQLKRVHGDEMDQLEAQLHAAWPSQLDDTPEIAEISSRAAALMAAHRFDEVRTLWDQMGALKQRALAEMHQFNQQQEHSVAAESHARLSGELTVVQESVMLRRARLLAQHPASSAALNRARVGGRRGAGGGGPGRPVGGGASGINSAGNAGSSDDVDHGTEKWGVHLDDMVRKATDGAWARNERISLGKAIQRQRAEAEAGWDERCEAMSSSGEAARQNIAAKHQAQVEALDAQLQAASGSGGSTPAAQAGAASGAGGLDDSTGGASGSSSGLCSSTGASTGAAEGESPFNGSSPALTSTLGSTLLSVDDGSRTDGSGDLGGGGGGGSDEAASSALRNSVRIAKEIEALESEAGGSGSGSGSSIASKVVANLARVSMSERRISQVLALQEQHEAEQNDMEAAFADHVAEQKIVKEEADRELAMFEFNLMFQLDCAEEELAFRSNFRDEHMARISASSSLDGNKASWAKALVSSNRNDQNIDPCGLRQLNKSEIQMARDPVSAMANQVLRGGDAFKTPAPGGARARQQPSRDAGLGFMSQGDRLRHAKAMGSGAKPKPSAAKVGM